MSTTACAWDTVIPFDVMWRCIKHVVKPKGAVVLFGSEPFSSLLRCSNLDWYRYDWKWDKVKASNVLNANRQPLRRIEDIAVFCEVQPSYNPQKSYNPKGVEGRGKYPYQGNRVGETTGLVNTRRLSVGYEPDKLMPTDIISVSKPHSPVHPTQKPVALMEYLIKTYTNEGETVLDFTAGSGTTAVAAHKTNRNCIAIEKDAAYFEIMQRRVRDAEMQPQLALTG